MPTKPPSSSTSVSASAATPAGTSAIDGNDGKAVDAKASTAPTAGASSSGQRSKRRLNGLALALAGAAAALLYGRLVLGMRVSPPLVMMGLGGLTLVLAALALWRVLEPLTDAEDRRGPAEHRAPHRIRELEREKLVVLKAIKEIELDFQMKKIGEADYREMVERYRARALRLMGELAVGEDYRALIEHELKGRLAVMRASTMGAAASAPATTTAPPAPVAPSAPATASSGTTEPHAPGVCPSCATRNDADARFCKSCATSLIASAGTTESAAASAPK